MENIIINKINNKIRIDDNQIKNCSAEEINFQYFKGQTPLLLAIAAGKINLSLRLLKHPAIDINLKNNNGSSALVKSLYFKEIVFAIFKKDDLIQSIKAENLYNFLLTAIKRKCWLILERIFNKIPFHLLNDSQILAILLAIILKGKWDLAEKVFSKISFIINDSIFIDLLDYLLEAEKYEMLKTAIQKCSFDAFSSADNFYIIFRILVKNRCDILYLIINKFSSLKLAKSCIEIDMPPLLQFLIFIGNNEFSLKLINWIKPEHLNLVEKSYRYSPLDIAILKQNLIVFYTLINRLPAKALYEQNKEFGYTPLHLAVLKQNLIMCQTLINKFPIHKLSIQDMIYKYTPLHLAIKLNNLDLISMFKFSDINLELEIKHFNKIKLSNDLLNEEICDLLNIVKINHNYFYFDFNKLIYKINSKTWSNIKIILKNIEDSINYLKDDEIFNIFQQIVKINAKTIGELILNLEKRLIEINNELINEIESIIINLKKIQYFQLETRNKCEIIELFKANKIDKNNDSPVLTDYTCKIYSYSINKVDSKKIKDLSSDIDNDKVSGLEDSKLLSNWHVGKLIWKNDLEKIQKLVAWNIRTFFYEILIDGSYYASIIIGKHKNDKQKYLVLIANWKIFSSSSTFLNFRWSYKGSHANFDTNAFMWVRKEQIIGFYNTNQKLWMNRKIQIALNLKKEFLDELEIRYFLF